MSPFSRAKDKKVKDDRGVHLAAFGKHPGWDDHIEDLGFDTAGLVEAKRLLYLEGIGGNIDAGAWERLAPEQRLGVFGHLLVRRAPDGIYIGRMWSSTDGKGRKRYPMVLLAQCVDVGLSWALEHVLAALERAERRCKDAATAEQVLAILDETRERLREALPPAEPPPLAPPGRSPGAEAAGTLVGCPDMGPDRVGMHRMLYQMDLGFSAGRPEPPRGANRAGLHRGFNLRLPVCADSVRDAVALWLEFLEAQSPPGVPIFLLLPLGEDWIDAIVGAPIRENWFCLLAATEALPLTTEIPYTLDPDFLGRSRAFCRDAAAGIAPRFVGGAEQDPAGCGRPGGGLLQRALKWIKTSRKTLLIALMAIGLTVPAALTLPTVNPGPIPRARRTAQRPPGRAKHLRKINLKTIDFLADVV